LLILRNQLDDLATARDPGRFAVESNQLRSHFLEGAEQATLALSRHSGAERDPTMLSTLETVQSSVRAQIDALSDLAAAGDWAAVRLRLQNQVAPLSMLTSQVVETVDSEVSIESAQASESIARLERRVFAMHILAALLALGVAGFLGTLVTKSITRPLAQLGAGAHVLALGDFQYRVAVDGNDELATLGRAFNDAAQRLDTLYRALRDSEERFRTVVNTAPVGIAVLDSSSTIRIFNQKFLEVTRLTSEQASGMNLGHLSIAVRREDGSVCPTQERPSQKAIATGKPVLNQVLRRQDRTTGEERWILTSAWPLLMPNGTVFQVITTLTDITEQKRVEEALRRSEEEFHIIFEHAAIGMVLVDPSRHLLRGNPEFRNMLGHTEKELPSLTLDDVTHPDDIGLNRSLFQDLLDGKSERFQIKERYIRKDGTMRSARVTVSALRDGEGAVRYCVAMVEDVTSQEIAERNLLQMSSRLLRIQEEEQRRIAREVHDSTSQEMTALTLNLGALKASAHSLPEKAKHQIAESLALAKQVAREIRTFSYLLHPPMLNELGLWSALRMFVQEFRERSGLLVDLEISPELEAETLSNSQEMALYRFVQETLANVHRHSGSRTASVRVQLNDSMIVASVADTGCGIADAVLKELRTSSGRSGGVGISGMYERIGFVGGELDIRSDGRGTTFSASMPLNYREESSQQVWPGLEKQFRA